MLRTTASILSAAVVTGCLSGEDAPAGTTTGSPSTPTETTSATPTEPTTAIDESAVVEYDALQPAAQEVFDRLLETGSVTDLTDVDGEAVRPLVVKKYVRSEGELHEVFGKRDLKERTVLAGVEPVDDEPDESRVVAYDELSDAGRQAFDAVRTGDDGDVSFHPVDYPFPDAGYVRYDGTVYSLDVARSTVEVFSFRIIQ